MSEMLEKIIVNNIEYFLDEKTLTYTPNLRPRETELPPLGKFGMLRKKFLYENRNTEYQLMSAQGRLFSHCLETEKAAQRRMSLIIGQMKREQGMTEQFKAAHQMEWVGLMNNICSAAEEIVLNELIYA